MGEGAVADEVGSFLEEAPLVRGRLRKGPDQVLRRHAGGVVFAGRRGTMVFPYATTQVFTSEVPGADDGELRGRAEWAFVRRGARWRAQGLKRSAPLAAVCRAATEASTTVRLAIVRQRLAAGDTVDFARLSATTHELWVHGHRPLPWGEAERLVFPEVEPVGLETVTRGRFTVADQAVQIADLAVLMALMEQGR